MRAAQKRTREGLPATPQGADSDTPMTQRGVTRPEHPAHQDSPSPESTSESSSDTLNQKEMLLKHHQKTLWIPWTVILLGFWLMLTPLTFNYQQLGGAAPSGNLEAWIPTATRLQVLFWNDLVSGFLLIVTGWRALTPARPISRWAACFVGIWLQFAPLVFWSPSALIYLNDTFVGVWVMALTILIPGMPNMLVMMKMGPEVPPGWSYNPSSWPQRWIMIGLGFAGWLVSRYLTAYQLGYLDQAWDPFFGESSQKVLTSKLSQTWPISDAGLGAFSYTFEFLMGWMGGTARWRTMPWMVLFFAILVVPLGLVHIFLVISQPVTVGYWCSFCLLAALIMLPMIPLALDEVVAMIQFMVKSMREGKPFWRTFWKGDTIDGEGMDHRSPELSVFPEKPVQIFHAAVWGISAPWNLSISAFIGLWLMFSPTVFGISNSPVADSNHLAGALIITVSVIAMAEVARLGRFFNSLLGLWVISAPWITMGLSTGSSGLLAGDPIAIKANNLACGIVITLLSIPRGKIRERYGTWDRYVW